MSKPDKGKTYGIGYGRPPVEHRFKKGQSGNPKGRPNGARNFMTDLKEILKLPVAYNTGDGRTKRISTQHASLLRLGQMALKGDLRALVRVIDLAIRYNSDVVEAAAEDKIDAEDEVILDAFLERNRPNSNSTKFESKRRRRRTK